jgi:transposase InsO family protein
MVACGQSVRALCCTLGRSEQAYYQWRRRHVRRATKERLALAVAHEARAKLPRLGTRKLQVRLLQKNIRMGRDTLFALLRAHQLLIYPRRRYHPTTRGAGYSAYADLRTTPTAPGQLWVSDITYVRLQRGGFRFLALVTDAYSRCIVGYHLGTDLSTATALAALRQAIAGRCAPPGLGADTPQLIHHSDRGTQYTAVAYRQTLAQAGILSSMTQHGSPYENALAERVNGILKHELQLGAVFTTQSQLEAQVHYAIFAYNHLRPHTALQYQTPAQVHFSHNPP